MLDIISQVDEYARLSRAVMPLLKFWQIISVCRILWRTGRWTNLHRMSVELTGYKQMLEQDAAKGHEDAADRLQNLGQLVSNVKSYCDQHGEEASLEGYLEDVALISDIDNYNESADQVVLMTIHSAKGLEFPYVFLIGMEEGVFPSEMSRYSEDDLEEERRLAYVGITRAKKELYLSNSVTRQLYGRTQRHEASRFVREIEPEYLSQSASPLAEAGRSMGWGSSYSDTVPGGRSGYSGPSGGRPGGFGQSYSQSYGQSYGGGRASGYLSRDYNARRIRPPVPADLALDTAAPHRQSRWLRRSPVRLPPQQNSTSPAISWNTRCLAGERCCGSSLLPENQFDRIQFDKVGVKKTMANFAPLTKLTTEE